MASICSISGCTANAVARGWCGKHWQRWRRYGDANHFVPQNEVERFWSFVRKSDFCWTWIGTVAGRYGQCRSSPRVRTPAHRFSWEMHNGPIDEGLFVCHHCDNPLCVRPDHLFLGTASDNMLDMSAKKRHPKQRQRYRAKLTPMQVAEIRSSNAGCRHLARRYAVSESTILQIKKRVTWKQITAQDPLVAESTMGHESDQS